MLSLSERSDEIVVDEIFQPEEIYPLSSNDTELVMNVATQNSNVSELFFGKLKIYFI